MKGNAVIGCKSEHKKIMEKLSEKAVESVAVVSMISSSYSLFFTSASSTAPYTTFQTTATCWYGELSPLTVPASKAGFVLTVCRL